jgi:hypothetical protein
MGVVWANSLPLERSVSDRPGLSALQTLDLAFNSLNSTTDRLAQVSMGSKGRCPS